MRAAGILGAILGLAAALGPALAGDPPAAVRFGLEAGQPPYADEVQGRPAGFTVELVEALAEVMGFRAEVQLAPWPATREAFAGGAVDVLAGAAYGDERLLPMVLSVPYGEAAAVLVTRHGSAVRALADLGGLEVLALAGDPAWGLVGQAAPSARVLAAGGAAEALRRLAAGRAEAAVLGDAELAGRIVEELGLSQLQLRPLDTAVRTYAFGVAPGHAELAARLSTGLAILRGNGKLQALHARWFGAPAAPAVDWLAAAGGLALLLALLGAGAAGWRLGRRRAAPRGPAAAPVLAVPPPAEEPGGFAGERLFKEIFKAAGDAILLLDENGFFDCNARALELFGCPDRKAMIVRNIADVSPPVQANGQNSAEAAVARAEEAWRNGTTRFEWLLRRDDGEVFPAEVLLSAFDLAGRKVLQATVRDISMRKWTEAALRNSERRMADIIDLLPDPTVVIDQDGRVQFWNRAMEDLTGIRAEQILGRGDYEYALPFYGERRPILIDAVRLPENEIETRYTNIRRVAETLIGESYVPHLRGGGVYVVGTAAPLYDSRGEYVGAIEIVRDITERRRAEAALEDSQRRLSHIIDFLPDATVVIDRAGKVITWNKAMADLTGVPAEAMLGRGNFETSLPFFGVRRPLLIDLVLRPDPAIEAEYFNLERRADALYGEIYTPVLKGEKVYVMGTASVLRDTRGLAVGAIEIVRNLSERKRMEEAMCAARDAAESATRAKSEFLANMSHEIRTPMNAIIGMTSLLLNTELTPEQRELTETTRMSGDTLLALINDILDFSKIEAGRLDLEAQPFDLRHCLESAVDLVGMRAGEKGLDLACLIEDGTPPTLTGDVTRLRQILVNLLNNAIKFTEAGEVVARVAMEAFTEAGADFADWATLHFSVRDTGIGIPPDRMDRLFKSFSQVDASTTRRYGGTGLGLAISSRLAGIMGGRMWVESTGVAGQGSTFHFTVRLPVSLEPVEQELADDLPELAGKRVMIVDDNPTNGLILTRQTEGWGMQPETFESPFEALETIERGVAFDLAILDMQMPDMDGMQLARGIRAVRDAAALPLIMLTSLGRRDIGADEVGFAAFLNKPIKSAALHDALRHALGGVRGPQQATPCAPSVVIDRDLGRRHPLRILVAEDYAINQKVALYTLAKMGYRADLASNGFEVLEALHRQPYDVVLMDVQMPEMDGLEATRRIRAEWAREAQPRIVAMTANAMQGDRDLCLAAGMDDYISKPVQVAELQAALLRCPRRSEEGPVPVASAAAPPAVDRATLLEFFPDLANGDTAMLREMAGMLLEDVPRRLEELAADVAAGKAEPARAILHTLKGASRSFGALHFASLCQDLEAAAKTGALPPAAEAAVAELSGEFTRVAEALNRELEPPAQA